VIPCWSSSSIINENRFGYFWILNFCGRSDFIRISCSSQLLALAVGSLVFLRSTLNRQGAKNAKKRKSTEKGEHPNLLNNLGDLGVLAVTF
jgi:hypothetical protein